MMLIVLVVLPCYCSQLNNIDVVGIFSGSITLTTGGVS